MFVLLLLFNNVFVFARINVVSSFSILGDIIEQIGKDKVKVFNIVKENQSIHSYNISPKDMKMIASSKMIFINGLHLENNSLLNAIKNSKIPYIEVSKGIQPINKTKEIKRLLKSKYINNITSHHQHYIDPHIWQDPILVIKYAENITKALTKIDYKNKDYYFNNFKEYKKKLINLNSIINDNLSKIPISKRNILISHDYLNYFAIRYKINVISVGGLSEDAHISAKKIKDVIKLVLNKDIKAIFIENINNTGIIKQISVQTNRKISGKLYTDALSSKKDPASNYLDMMKYNADQIVNALYKVKE